MSVLWDNVSVKPGTKSLTSEGGVVYDAGDIEGLVDQDDVFCLKPSNMIDDDSCYSIEEAPEDKLTEAFGKNLKMGAKFADLASKDVELGSVDEEIELNVDVNYPAVAFLVTGSGIFIGAYIGYLISCGTMSLATMAASPALQAKMGEENSQLGYADPMSNIS